MSPALQRTILSSLACAFAAGLFAVGTLHAFPFLARVDGLADHPPTPELWAGFVEAAFVFGALAGLTSILPLKRLRASAVLLLSAAATLALIVAAMDATLSSMHSGDSLLALILISPILLMVGIAYVIFIFVALAVLAIGASFLKALLEPQPIAALIGALATGFAAAIFVLYPSIRATMGSSTPAIETPPPPPPAPILPCRDTPFVEEVRRAPGIRAVSAERVPADSSIVLYLVGGDDSGDGQIVSSAQDALHGQLKCSDAGRDWTASFIIAAPRALTIHLRIKPQRNLKRENLEMRLASSIRGETRNYLNADPNHPGRFVTQLGFETANALPHGAIESMACAPASGDLECIAERIAVAQSGVYPRVEGVQVEWATKSGK